jgi:hypothetical protein
MIGGDENSAGAMGLVISNIDELRRPTSATVILVHHSGKNKTSERGSSALRGAADVMIEVTGEVADGFIKLTCDKMKDAEPFKPASIGVERIVLGPSLSSLAVTTWKDALESMAAQAAAKSALKVLEGFGTNGATHGEWKQAYVAATGQSPSTFGRNLTKLKDDGAVRQQGNKYYPIRATDGVSVNPVSPGCHDIAPGDGVGSPPPLGGDP